MKQTKAAFRNKPFISLKGSIVSLMTVRDLLQESAIFQQTAGGR